MGVRPRLKKIAYVPLRGGSDMNVVRNCGVNCGCGNVSGT